MKDDKIVFEDYGLDDQFVSDHPHTLTRLSAEGWPAAIERFLEKQCVWIASDADRDRVYPWRTFARDPEFAPKSKDGDHYDHDCDEDPDDGYRPRPYPCVNFDLAIPLPKTFHIVESGHEVALDMLRGHPPETLRKNILARTGQDIADPALTWQQRFDRCIFAWPAWRKPLMAAMTAAARALDNQRLFGHDTIEAWALKHWGGSNCIHHIDFERVGNDPVSHRFVTGKDRRRVEFVFLTYNAIGSIFPVPRGIFERLAAGYPPLRIDMVCRAFNPEDGERAVWRARSDRGKITREATETSGSSEEDESQHSTSWDDDANESAMCDACGARAAVDSVTSLCEDCGGGPR